MVIARILWFAIFASGFVFIWIIVADTIGKYTEKDYTIAVFFVMAFLVICLVEC